MIVVDLLADENPVPEGGMDWRALNGLTVCKKRWFATEWSALGYRNKVRNEFGKDQRQYYCRKCFGWHLTSRLMPWQIKNARAMGYNA